MYVISKVSFYLGNPVENVFQLYPQIGVGRGDMVHRIYIIDERISYVKRLALQSQRGNVSQSYGQNRHWQILCISILYRGEQWNHKTLEWSSRICSAIKRRHSHVYYRYFGSSAICQIWYLGKKLGTFPKAFYQVATSQMCNFPSGHFPIVCSRRSAHVSGTLDNLV